MKHAFILCVVVSVAWIVSSATPSQAADEVLTNASITEMKGLGLGDDVIIQKIKTSTCNFDVSMDGLKALKAAQVSDAVIQAMLATQGPPSTPPELAKPGDVNDPAAPHDPGIWLYQEANGQKTMTKIEPSQFEGKTKQGFGFFALYGETTKVKAIMNSAHARLQLDAQPVFYFYFVKTQSGLGDPNVPVVTPEDFTLLKMEVKKDKDERRVVVGHIGLYGSNGHHESKALEEIDSQKIDSGIYKVTPRTELSDGEYCIVFTGNDAIGGYWMAAGPGKAFCFGIKTGLKEKD
jgi:hypothetical protein